MDERGLRPGHILALAGAVTAIGSLWAHWYSIGLARITQALLTQSSSVLSPAANQLVQSRLSSLPDSLSVNAWQAFQQTDIAVAVLSGLVLLVVLAASGSFGSGIRVDLAFAGSACMALGAACAMVIVNRVLHTPGPSGVATLQLGAYLGLAGAGAMTLGGVWAAAAGSAAPASTTLDLWAKPTPEPADPVSLETAASVAPPVL
jgi:hypothetical protein